MNKYLHETKSQIFLEPLSFLLVFFRRLPCCWLSHLVLLASWTPSHHLSRQENGKVTCATIEAQILAQAPIAVTDPKSYTQSVKSLAVLTDL